MPCVGPSKGFGHFFRKSVFGAGFQIAAKIQKTNGKLPKFSLLNF
jgi:hypothetical protein